MRRRARPLFGALACITLAACDTYSCRWTTEPDRSPYPMHEPDRVYPTDHGAFELVVRAEDWPLGIGSPSLRIEARALEADAEAAPRLFVASPSLQDSDWMAESAPTVVELETGL